MMKERDTRCAHFLPMGLCLLAVLSVASSPGWALSGDFDDLFLGSLTVGLTAAEELNLLPPGALTPQSPGAAITGNLYVFGPYNGEQGGTVNIEYALITGLIVVNPGAKVTIQGKDFAVSGAGVLDDPMNPTSVSFKTGPGTLTVTYANGTTTELRFIYTSQEIYLGAGAPETLEVDIDIKPGSNENPINPRSNGVVPVAIFSKGDFDATQIDPASIDLGGARVATRGKSGKLMARPEDVNGDGKMDLMVQVELPSDGAGWSTGEIQLSAKTFGGQEIGGSDSIVIVPAKK